MKQNQLNLLLRKQKVNKLELDLLKKDEEIKELIRINNWWK